MKDLFKSATMWLTTTGVFFFYLVDDNVSLLASIMSDFAPYSELIIGEYLEKYNKLILLITLSGTGYGRLRTDRVNKPLSERELL